MISANGGTVSLGMTKRTQKLVKSSFFWNRVTSERQGEDHMKLYLAYGSALDLARYLRSTEGGGLKGSTVRRTRLRDAICTAHGLWGLGPTAELRLSHVDPPIHALSGDRCRATITRGLVTHYYGGALPAGSYLDLGNDLCICTAPFLFLQLANILDFTELLSVGMELCGHYSKWRLPPAHPESPELLTPKENHDCTFNLKPATTAAKIRSFLERTGGLHGAVPARAAAKWLLNGAASPMETIIYLLLCLPKRLGGYGLPQPTLNPKVSVRSTDGIVERYPDLYWPERAIDVEYNSDYFHSDDWSRYRDSKREVELVTNRIAVLPLTRQQVMNADDFDAFARGLRRLLGIRSRGFDKGWESRRDNLRGKLLPNR